MTGKVYLIGAGCGEADLITLKGLKKLLESDVVLYLRWETIPPKINASR